MKGRLKPGENLHRGVRARHLVGIKQESLCRRLDGAFTFSTVAVGQRSDFHLDASSFVFEFAGGQRADSLFVGVHGKLVGLFARDAKFARDVFVPSPMLM